MLIVETRHNPPHNDNDSGIIVEIFDLFRMTQDPRLRAAVTDGTQSGHQESAGHTTALFQEPPKLTQVARTLAAHGGGALSVDLAFDLLLNDVAQKARDATGAGGAAVALLRDGEFVCRATTGENAPDLGVRVDGTSGLAGACVSTGEMQQCVDTEGDPRVNAEACRRLGVRSMLIAPLVDSQKIIGIIQVLSASPNSFGKQEITALQVLAGRIAESNREAQAELSAIKPTESSEPEINIKPLTREAEGFSATDAGGKGMDLRGTVLVVLVIAAALILGFVIGWPRAAKLTKVRLPPRTIAPAATLPAVEATSQNNTVPPDASTSKGPGVAEPASAGGGLLVTQNGNVVYRSPSEAVHSASPQPQRSLIHRVEPEYPEEARARHIQGSVVLDVQVLGTGAVGNVGVVSGDPLLARSAIDAVKQWRYQPESVNRQAIESQTRITVKFRLPD